MSIAEGVRQAFEQAWTVQADAWGFRTVVRDRGGAESVLEAVWPTMTERASGGAGGFSLGHDARVAWRRDSGVRPQIGWLVSKAGSNRVLEVVEVDDTSDPVTWRCALQAMT